MSCATCRHFRRNFCRSPDGPYGGKPRIGTMGCWAWTTTFDFPEKQEKPQ